MVERALGGQLATASIDAFYAELRSHGGGDGCGLTDGTVHRIHGLLRLALTQAVCWEWVWTIRPSTPVRR